LDISGLDFYTAKDGTAAYCTGGYIGYVDDNGSIANIPIPFQSFGGEGGYIYFHKGSPYLGLTTNLSAIKGDPDNVILAQWSAGSTALRVTYGGTIIHGDRIDTGTINADRLIVNSIDASQYLRAGTIIANRFLTNAGVDLAAIVPGSVNFRLSGGQGGSFNVDPGGTIGPFARVGYGTFNGHQVRATVVYTQSGGQKGTGSDPENKPFTVRPYIAISNNGGANWGIVGYLNGTTVIGETITQRTIDQVINYQTDNFGSSEVAVFFVSDGVVSGNIQNVSFRLEVSAFK
jgi:hypothetical protein